MLKPEIPYHDQFLDVSVPAFGEEVVIYGHGNFQSIKNKAFAINNDLILNTCQFFIRSKNVDEAQKASL